MQRIDPDVSRGPRRPFIGLLVLTAIVAAATLAACNTTEGVGKDVKSLGKGVEESAQEAK